MIEAAHGGKLSPTLALARQCERWGVAAVLGHDPPYKVLLSMSHAVKVVDIIQTVESAKTPEDIRRIAPDVQRWYHEHVKAKGL